MLRVAPPDDSVFVFYERDMMRQEPALHALVRERTTVPVADIVAYDESRSIIDRPFLLMERLPGEPLCDMSGINSNVVFQQAGACLAQVHAIRADTYGYLGEHQPMKPQTAWADAFAVMWRKLIEDVALSEHYGPDECNAMYRLLDRCMPAIDRPVPSCLLHMDLWAENVLVSPSGELTGLIDWDRALWGDPEIEFAVLDYCGVSVPAFWEGYGRARDASIEAEIRQMIYLLYEIQKYIVINEGRNKDRSSAHWYARHSLQMASQLTLMTNNL